MSTQRESEMDILIDFIWSQYAFMIKSANLKVLNVPNSVVNIIGDAGVDTIARSFSAVIGAPTKRYRDRSLGMVRIMPANFHLGHLSETTPPKQPVAKKDKTPRPPNAFILYRQRHHPLLKAKYPTLHNNQISIILGKQWQLEDEQTKAQFKSAADSLKKKHLVAHPDYQYQPRKASEKKRRMTRRHEDHTSSGGNLTTDDLVHEPTDIPNDIVLEHAGVPDDSVLEPTDVDCSVPNVETTAMETPNVETAPTEIPTFDTTPAGYPTFDLGDDNFDDDTFAAMLENFNATLDNNTGSFPSAVIYSDPTEEAQNDFNLFNTFLHFDELLEDA